MERVIGSKVDFTDLSNPDILEFRSYVDDIWSSEMVQRLDNYEQHHKTSRKQHSLNVAYYSFKIAKKIGANPRLSLCTTFTGMTGTQRKFLSGTLCSTQG